MPFYEVMGWPGPITGRQFEVWSMWDDMQWNVPDRSDWYKMLIAFHVARSNAKDPRTVDFNKIKLKFDLRQRPKLSREQAAKLSKANALAMLGATRVRLPDGSLVSARDVIRGELDKPATGDDEL